MQIFLARSYKHVLTVFFLSPCSQSLLFSHPHHPIVLHRATSPLLCPSFCLSLSLSVSKQQIQTPTAQPTAGPPLVPSSSQPPPSGTSQQVRLPGKSTQNSSYILNVQFFFLTSLPFSPYIISFHTFPVP